MRALPLILLVGLCLAIRIESCCASQEIETSSTVRKIIAATIDNDRKTLLKYVDTPTLNQLFRYNADLKNSAKISLSILGNIDEIYSRVIPGRHWDRIEANAEHELGQSIWIFQKDKSSNKFVRITLKLVPKNKPIEYVVARVMRGPNGASVSRVIFRQNTRGRNSGVVTKPTKTGSALSAFPEISKLESSPVRIGKEPPLILAPLKIRLVQTPA